MAVDLFLKLDSIPGESQEQGHVGEIALLAFNFSGTNPSSASGPAGAGKVSLGAINVSKNTDSASVKLFLALCKGTHLPSGTLSAVRASGSGQPYLTIQLTDVVITSFELGASAGVPVENVSFNYRTIQLTYSVQNPDGSMGAKIVGGWDLAKNAPL